MDMGIPVIGKFSSARSVWMPKYACSGTSLSPRRSCSIRKEAGIGVDPGDSKDCCSKLVMSTHPRRVDRIQSQFSAPPV